MPKQNIQSSFGRDLRRDVHGEAAESHLHLKGAKSMSRQTRQFFEQLKSGEPPTLVESIKGAASVLKDIGGQIWDGAKPMFDHGRAEAANLLFSGQAHVMYMKGQKDIEQGQNQEHDQSKEATQDQCDLGREM